MKYGSPIEGEVFRVVGANTGMTKTGDPMLRYQLVQRNIIVGGKPWFRPTDQHHEDFRDGQCVKVWGHWEDYLGNPQITIDDYAHVAAGSPEALLTIISLSEEQIIKNSELMLQLINEIPDAYGEFIQHLFFENRMQHLDERHKTNFEAFCVYPGANYHHHAYRGGLCQHTLECYDFVKALLPVAESDYYEQVYDRPLLKAGVLLHDVGKLMDYDENIDLSNEIKYGDHLLSGRDYVAALNMHAQILTREQELKIKYIVCAHHGEFGIKALAETIEDVPELNLIKIADQMSANLANKLTMIRIESE